MMVMDKGMMGSMGTMGSPMSGGMPAAAPGGMQMCMVTRCTMKRWKSARGT